MLSYKLHSDAILHEKQKPYPKATRLQVSVEKCIPT